MIVLYILKKNTFYIHLLIIYYELHLVLRMQQWTKQSHALQKSDLGEQKKNKRKKKPT